MGVLVRITTTVIPILLSPVNITWLNTHFIMNLFFFIFIHIVSSIIDLNSIEPIITIYVYYNNIFYLSYLKDECLRMEKLHLCAEKRQKKCMKMQGPIVLAKLVL